MGPECHSASKRIPFEDSSFIFIVTLSFIVMLYPVHACILYSSYYDD